MNNTTEVTQMFTPARAVLSILPCLFILYVNGVMLFTFLRKPHFLEASHYILFGHLLLADSLQLVVVMMLYFFAVTFARMFTYVCVIVTLLGGITVRVSPLNLAAMSLEKYIAICFPLRYADIAVPRTTGIAIAVMWTMASIDSLIQFFLFVSLENRGSAPLKHCSKKIIFTFKIYSTVNTAFTTLIFVVVSNIIIYTYICIIVAVRAATTNVSEASKASKTVLLHLLQLCLYATSTLFNMINTSDLWKMSHVMAINFQYALFLCLIIFPKCLSPLIYGLRDRTFRQVFKYYFTFGFKAIVYPVRTS
ncbi:odorant receptor 131-2-like [Aulostomus maculatus]